MPTTKELVLALAAAIALAAALLLWQRAVPLVIAGEFQSYFRFAAPVAAMAAGGTLFSLAGIFVRDRKIVMALVAVAVAIPFFFLKPSGMVIAVLIFSVLLMLVALNRLRKEFIFSIGFSLTKIVKAGLPLYFTVGSLVVATFYLSNIDEDKAISGLLPKPTFQFIIERLSTPLSGLTGVPKITSETTIDEIIADFFNKELESLGVDASKIPVREFVQFSETQRQELTQRFGIQLSGKETVSDVFYNQIIDRIKDLLGPYKVYLPLASAIAFFFAFKTLTLPLYYLTVLLTFGLIKILVAAKLIKSEKMQIEVEKLTM